MKRGHAPQKTASDGWLLHFVWYVCLRYEMYDVVLQAYGGEGVMPKPTGKSQLYSAWHRVTRRIGAPLRRAVSEDWCFNRHRLPLAVQSVPD